MSRLRVDLMSGDKVPQCPYLTTISAAYFNENIAGHGWKWVSSWLIGEDGTGAPYYLTSKSEMIPNAYDRRRGKRVKK
jgi:hypothetical protein